MHVVAAGPVELAVVSEHVAAAVLTAFALAVLLPMLSVKKSGLSKDCAALSMTAPAVVFAMSMLLMGLTQRLDLALIALNVLLAVSYRAAVHRFCRCPPAKN